MMQSDASGPIRISPLLTAKPGYHIKRRTSGYAQCCIGNLTASGAIACSIFEWNFIQTSNLVEARIPRPSKTDWTSDSNFSHNSPIDNPVIQAPKIFAAPETPNRPLLRWDPMYLIRSEARTSDSPALAIEETHE